MANNKVSEQTHHKFYLKKQGIEMLTITDKFDRRKKICTQTTSTFIPMWEVSKQELIALRKEKNPGFVLKLGNRLFYANIWQVPKNIRLVLDGDLSQHICSSCCRLSAASDEEGGCAKTRALARHIERYEWITLGYETFNALSGDVLYVLKCNHFCTNSSK